MKTSIYLDGFNFYYGCLKHSQDKWLDIHRLFFEKVVFQQTPNSELVSLKYFTAPIRAKIATHGVAAVQAQGAYHRALNVLYPEKIEIINGFFGLEKANLPAFKQPIDKSERLSVWKLEEKESDVNIALESYRDAAKEKCEQLVFVSNDTDIAPALKAIKEDFPAITIGLIVPLRKAGIGDREINKKLSGLADWTRRYLTDKELSESNLPVKILTNRKPIIKPDYW